MPRLSVRRIRKIDDILKGEIVPSQTEIGIRVGGRSRETVRQYLTKTKQHKLWERKNKKYRKYQLRLKKQEALEKKGTEETFNRLLIGLEEQDWPYAKALQYYFDSRRRKGYMQPLRKLVKLFEVSLKAKISGERLGYQEVANLSGIGSGVIVRDILIKSGLKHLIVEKSDLDGGLLKRLFYSDLSARDIVYFLRLEENLEKTSLEYHFRKIGKRKTSHVPFGIIGLTKKGVSKIYRLKDAGLKLEQIAEFLEIKPDKIDFALKNRAYIEEEIIRNLNKIFKTKYTKPYHPIR